MTNRYKNRKNAVVNPPYEGKHCKTLVQRARRHARNELYNWIRDIMKRDRTRANTKG